MVDVSVVIVNYKTKGLVKECIKSIKNHTKTVSYEIIVVDNASEDISELQSDTVQSVQLKENVGFGRANNAGANISNGNALFFLNPDTVLINEAIDILYDTLMNVPDCGVCGANLYDVDYNPIHSYYYCTMSLKHALRCATMAEKRIHHISNQHNFEDELKSVDYITGADLMIRKNLFCEIGGFNPGIFMYYEDVDLCSKVRNRHKKCYSVPKAKIQHLEGQSFTPSQSNQEIIRRRKSQMSGDSIAVFLRSNYKRYHYNAILSANILILRLKLVSYKIISKDQSGAKQQLDFFKYIRSRI